jgi:uncharacterized membrane protein
MVCTSTQTYTVTIVFLYVVPGMYLSPDKRICMCVNRRLMWTPPTRPEMVSPQYVPPPVRLQWCHGIDINTRQRKYTVTIVFVYVVPGTYLSHDKCICMCVGRRLIRTDEVMPE